MFRGPEVVWVKVSENISEVTHPSKAIGSNKY